MKGLLFLPTATIGQSTTKTQSPTMSCNNKSLASLALQRIRSAIISILNKYLMTTKTKSNCTSWLFASHEAVNIADQNVKYLTSVTILEQVHQIIGTKESW